MYLEVARLLDEANADAAIVFTVFTGVGEFFSSGSDFNMQAAARLMNAKISEHLGRKSRNRCEPRRRRSKSTRLAAFRAAGGRERYPPYFIMITALIEHNKYLVALVNGPAVGIGVTMLALFDCVAASDSGESLAR